MVYDIIVIGGGPAGLTAALYARRANKSVLILEKATFGGQITYSPKVENIPGFLELSGNEFAEKLVEQVLEQGAEVECAEVQRVVDGEIKTVITDEGEFTAKAVIVATGAKHRMLGLEGEEALVGEGISFCAVCDGAFYEGKTVAVIGGGNSALQEALLLADLCKTVHVIQNLPSFTGEQALADRLAARDNVTVRFNTTVSRVIGDGALEAIELSNADGTTDVLPLDGMFVAIGLVPQNEIVSDLIDLDVRGYVDAGEDCLTKCAGIFTAGDCRTKTVRQVTTAAADGAIAALAACEYVNTH
ncbi:MAG: FAD-dependent oxidoreductase [Ruminococcaceae bacterium]|nr:FAD-dependent oxidoreductase [Oscillospiraceae bacterium]